jgi:hypothetical protein
MGSRNRKLNPPPQIRQETSPHVLVQNAGMEKETNQNYKISYINLTPTLNNMLL